MITPFNCYVMNWQVSNKTWLKLHGESLSYKVSESQSPSYCRSQFALQTMKSFLDFRKWSQPIEISPCYPEDTTNHMKQVQVDAQAFILFIRFIHQDLQGHAARDMKTVVMPIHLIFTKSTMNIRGQSGAAFFRDLGRSSTFRSSKHIFSILKKKKARRFSSMDSIHLLPISI